MTKKVLFVDDDTNLLAAIERQFRKQYTIEVASSAAHGLTALEKRGPFAVVVSDLSMPVLDGIQFLSRVRQQFPDTIRVLLTGYADIHQSIEAVNSGGIFRFLTKPTPPDKMMLALDAALEQYRLIMSERELLDHTLRGSLQVLGEILEIVRPEEFGRAMRVQRLIRDLAKLVPGAASWDIDVSAILSQLGSITISKEILHASTLGSKLAEEDRRQLEAAPHIAKELLRAIPRLEKVSEIVDNSERHFNDGMSPDSKSGTKIPLGSRLLKMAFDYDHLLDRKIPKLDAVLQLRGRTGWYDPELLNALEQLISNKSAPEMRQLSAVQLRNGMILGQNLYTENGRLLLSEGHLITEPIRLKLESFAMMGQLPSSIRVLVNPEEHPGHF